MAQLGILKHPRFTLGILMFLLVGLFSCELANASNYISPYAKTRKFVCEATLYGVDYDIQSYIGKRYNCKPIWDEMVREELISFNQK